MSVVCSSRALFSLHSLPSHFSPNPAGGGEEMGIPNGQQQSQITVLLLFREGSKCQKNSVHSMGHQKSEILVKKSRQRAEAVPQVSCCPSEAKRNTGKFSNILWRENEGRQHGQQTLMSLEDQMRMIRGPRRAPSAQGGTPMMCSVAKTRDAADVSQAQHQSWPQTTGSSESLMVKAPDG